MKDEITDEEIWPAIWYLDPDDKHKEVFGTLGS